MLADTPRRPRKTPYPTTQRQREVLTMTVRAMRREGMPFYLIGDVLNVSIATAWRYRDSEFEADRKAARRVGKPWLTKAG